MQLNFFRLWQFGLTRQPLDTSQWSRHFQRAALVLRYGLEPTKVLIGGSASSASDTYRLFLTSEEMSCAVAIGPQRRLNKALAAHVDSVRRICRHAEHAGHAVDEMALLDELAGAVPNFLEWFREREVVDPDAELACDLERIAIWLASPHRDIELARYFEDTRSERVPPTQTMAA